MSDLTGGRLGAEQRANGDNRSAARWAQDVQAQQNAPGAAFGGALNPAGGQSLQAAMVAAPLPHDGSVSSNHLAALVAAAGHSPQARVQKAAQADTMVHTLGTLARKPDLTSRDVLDAATTAIKNGHAGAEQAADFIGKLPGDSDPAKLRAAVRQKFADALLASVHLAGPQQGAPGAAP